MKTLSIIRPDDWHLHVRDGKILSHVVPFTAKQMGRAIIMPNLKLPIINIQDALSYRKRILSAVPENNSFNPLMTIYLTDNTSKESIKEAKEAGIVAFKLYPAGATTNSDAGVTDLFKLLPVLEEMSRHHIKLLVHGEVTDSHIDIFDREAVFIDRILIPLIERLPELKIVLEHVTTKEGASFVSSAGENIAATVTPQHLLLNRNDLLVGGIRPHHYCLPILKREEHRNALVQAVTGQFSGKFFLGTDSAPHSQDSKESSCGCAGVFSAFSAIELYAEIFEQVGALDKLEAFASLNGPKFYGLPINTEHLTLVKEAFTIPEYLTHEEEKLIPFYANKQLSWRIV